MAQERKPKAVKTREPEIDKPGKDTFRGFANIELTEVHKEWVKKNMDDVSMANDYETELITAGFKVTMSFDYESDCYVASATGTSYIPKSAGIAVSARAMDKEAAKLALYCKIVSVAEWDLEPYVKSNKRPLDI